MIDTVIIGLFCTLVVAAFIWRTFKIVEYETREGHRGSDKTSGFHTIHSEYSSGVSGHHTTYKVPCDPDEYARFFIPKKTDSKK